MGPRRYPLLNACWKDMRSRYEDGGISLNDQKKWNSTTK